MPTPSLSQRYIVTFPTEARLLAGLIALSAWFGIGLEFSSSYARTGTLGETIWNLCRYFTVTTNAPIALTFSALTLNYSNVGKPSLLAGIAAFSLLVGGIYELLLRNSNAPVASLLLHVATPLLVPVFWFAFVPKGTLTDRDPLHWILYPLGYFLYALVRGWAEQRSPYPFMDVSRLGWLQIGINGLIIGITFLAMGLAIVRLDRWQASIPRGDLKR
jgi:hypothetical protein